MILVRDYSKWGGQNFSNLVQKVGREMWNPGRAKINLLEWWVSVLEVGDDMERYVSIYAPLPTKFGQSAQFDTLLPPFYVVLPYFL